MCKKTHAVYAHYCFMPTPFFRSRIKYKKRELNFFLVDNRLQEELFSTRLMTKHMYFWNDSIYFILRKFFSGGITPLPSQLSPNPSKNSQCITCRKIPLFIKHIIMKDAFDGSPHLSRVYFASIRLFIPLSFVLGIEVQDTSCNKVLWRTTHDSLL